MCVCVCDASRQEEERRFSGTTDALKKTCKREGWSKKGDMGPWGLFVFQEVQDSYVGVTC